MDDCIASPRSTECGRPTDERVIANAFDRFEDNTLARVAVLWGKVGHFCSGADLKAMSDPNRRKIISADGTGPGPMEPTDTNAK